MAAVDFDIFSLKIWTKNNRADPSIGKAINSCSKNCPPNPFRFISLEKSGCKNRRPVEYIHSRDCPEPFSEIFETLLVSHFKTKFVSILSCYLNEPFGVMIPISFENFHLQMFYNFNYVKLPRIIIETFTKE